MTFSAYPPLLILVLACLNGCESPAFSENEVGDQLELIGKSGESVKPDVVFYKVSGMSAAGVRRVGSSTLGSASYWSKCQIFLADSGVVTYFSDVETIGERQRQAVGDEILKQVTIFARSKCENFMQ